MGVQVKLWNPLRTRAIPERFCGGDSVRSGGISSVSFYWPRRVEVDLQQQTVAECNEEFCGRSSSRRPSPVRLCPSGPVSQRPWCVR